MALPPALGLKDWLRSGLDLVYPRNCQACQQALTQIETGVLCQGCLATVKRIEPPFCDRCALPFAGKIEQQFTCGYCRDLELHFRRAVAACRAQGLVRDCIHRFKYDRQMYYGPHLAEWLVQAGRQWINWDQIDALVPVPLHPRKKRHRQFNQAEYLALAAAKAFDKPVLARALRRLRDTETQTHLDAAGRRANLQGAFAARPAAVLASLRLVLVDDVFTTGATLDACASVLRRAGAGDIIVLTVARGV